MDNPEKCPPEFLRYDVGLLVSEEFDNKIESLSIRELEGGIYAVFEVEHTKEGVEDFWNKFPTIATELAMDYSKPVIERYALEKIKMNKCEFCVPLINNNRIK